MDCPKVILPYLIEENDISWGPVSSPEALSFCLGPINNYPFMPSIRQERSGRICDFTHNALQKISKDSRNQVQSCIDDFQLVDSRTSKSNRSQYRYSKRMPNNRRQNYNTSQQSQQQTNNQSYRGNQVQATNVKLSHQTLRIQQWQKMNRQRHLAEWSIEPQQDWELIEVRLLNSLPRLFLNSSSIEYEDIEWRGELCVYDRHMDKIIPKNPIPLLDTFSQNYSYYWPGTADDSIILNHFKNREDINVAATDQILSCLMSAFHSRVSWHLIFYKNNNRMFIDKQNGTSVDLITVDETNKESPLSDNPFRINRPAELGAEALKIHQNFSQQTLNRNLPAVQTYKPAPFVDRKDIPASKLYRYRIITLPGQPNGATPFSQSPIKIITRGEIDAVVMGEDNINHNIIIRSLNEYNPTRNGKCWKTQLDSQKGALIAQETKNNHCKVGKWVAQALIAGCEYLKVGFVSRVCPDNNTKHQILNVQTYKVRDLGVQIGLNTDNVWGIIRGIIDPIMALSDGTYILVKDPIKPEIKLYRTLSQMQPENPMDIDSNFVNLSDINATKAVNNSRQNIMNATDSIVFDNPDESAK